MRGWEAVHALGMGCRCKPSIGGIEWGFNDLAVQTCRFIVVGTAFAALLLTVVPTSFILDYLSDPRLMSLLGIIDTGFLPRTHGSGLFKRGQTQALSVATLGKIGRAHV